MDSKWPYCEALKGECIAHEVSGKVGQDLLSQFLTFVRRSEEGSRLILQHNRDSFTIQVTGSVKRGAGDMLSREQFEALRGEKRL